MTETLILGRTLGFEGDPFREGPAAARIDERGAVLVEDGRIAATGPADELRARHPGAALRDYGGALVTAGFVDAHAHYPQTAIIASWGKRLIDWLNIYTFPEEMRLADPAYAAEIAARHLDLVLAHGTTTVASYCTDPRPQRRRLLRGRRGARDGGGGRAHLHGPQRPRRPARHRPGGLRRSRRR